uniref:Uncharacterized protein n=2 Tax=Opuntia streptacantha TaxID=393608 RepID=A0A7C8ZRC2_OPUST
MADKPSRALILYGYGLAPLISPSHSHIHSVASRGCCGFLALDDPSPSPVTEDEKLMREVAQLLDASEAFCSADGEKGSTEDLKKVPSIAERFMGMSAAIVTGAPAVKCFGEKLGFTAVESVSVNLRDGQSSEVAAMELLKLLGFEGGKTLDKDHFDLVFLHLGAHIKENGQHEVECMNSLIGSILQAAQPRSEIGSRLHLSVVMSYGSVMEDDPNLSLMSLQDGNSSGYSSLLPRQSYTLKGVNLRNGIRHHNPMLIAQWQDAVTRKDLAEDFSFNEFRKHSGNLAIPADRFVYEVAFKLWKAPKYGA